MRDEIPRSAPASRACPFACLRSQSSVGRTACPNPGRTPDTSIDVNNERPIRYPRLMSKWLLLALLVPACAAEDSEVVEVGVVNPDLYPVEYPARVVVGEVVTITVVSYGDGCTAFDSTDVQATDAG